MVSGVCLFLLWKEDGWMVDCNEYREFFVCIRRNLLMDLLEKENKMGGYFYDDFCLCRCSWMFVGVYVVGY